MLALDFYISEINNDLTIAWQMTGNSMPYVNLKVAGELNRQQKEQIAKEFTETLQKVAGKPPEATYIVIEEVSRENWAKGGALLAKD